MALWKKEDSAEGAPKWLQAEEGAAPHDGMVENADAVFPSDIDDAVFVDAGEASVAGNRAKGLKTPGWHVNEAYTTADGTTRVRSECLVAMSGAGTAASVTIGDAGVTGNTDIEDTVAEDPEE
jgi:hypothetical protein